eukprot:Skav215422  [mRNA]  locus=scaffold1865:6539:6829:+ [translate_table: standard]
MFCGVHPDGSTETAWAEQHPPRVFEMPPDADCAICWERLTEFDHRLSCGHAFHLSCARDWLARHDTCPTCRARVQLRGVLTYSYGMNTAVRRGVHL